MQSSGASLVAFFLAQKPNTFVIVDVYSEHEAPILAEVDVEDIVLKCVVTAKFSLETHVHNFNPDKKILVLRHPYHNYVSLKSKPWADGNSSIEEKFKILNNVLNNRNQFDLVIMYEDLLFNPCKVLREIQKIGYEATEDFFKFNRSRNELLHFNCQHSEQFRAHYLERWGWGNIDLSGNKLIFLKIFKYISQKEKTKVHNLCPALYYYYKKNFRWNLYKVFIYILCIAKLERIKPRLYLRRFKYYALRLFGIVKRKHAIFFKRN